MSGFDLMSDIHIDIWNKMDSNLKKMESKVKNFSMSLIPDVPNNTLVIPGDLGNYNLPNLWFLQVVSKHYENVLWVAGNHDYYLETKTQKRKYNNDSNNRIIEMKSLTNELTNIHFLDGDKIELEGILYGGTGMWYDFQYSQQSEGFQEEDVWSLWAKKSNDRHQIRGFLPMEKFKEERDKLNKVVDELDVIITHVGPNWDLAPYKGEDSHYNNYYFFNGDEFLNNRKEQIWCFGHTHTNLDIKIGNTRFISHCLGYPREGLIKKFKQVEIK